MSKVTLTRAELDRIAVDLGLPAGSSIEAMLARAGAVRAARDAEEAAQARAAKVAAAQRYLVDEDRRLVNAAINDGRIPAERKGFWVAALGRDRAGNRPLLASLAPGLPPAQRVVEDEALERTHGAVLARLGVAKDAPRPRPRDVRERPVRASAPTSPPRQAVDGLGLPIPGIPAPVLTSRGTPPSEWTADDHYANFASMLGPRFAAGAGRPPAPATYYLPGPNDISRPVVGPDGTVTHWEANPDYQPQY
ncbi:hypothetical protein ACK280_26245 [Mycobacterium sherrisii]|uniref:hypothetical protein n=1 Tax=Mycobacterium sherrisii TaxID=243061 RepID=UPI00397665DF